MLRVDHVAASGSLLIRLEPLWLSLRHRLVKVGLTSLIDAPRVGVESARVVTKRLKLLVFRTAGALETDARLACTLRTVVSALVGRNILGISATTSLACAADTDRSTRKMLKS